MSRSRHPVAAVRALAAAVTGVATIGTSLAFGFIALIVASFNCEDGCAPGSRFATGAWGTNVELWALAVPAVFAAIALTVAVSLGRRWASALSWVLVTGLLVAWCVFTGVTQPSINFSESNSHWMWLAGLLVTGVGGMLGVIVCFIYPATPSRRKRAGTPST